MPLSLPAPPRMFLPIFLLVWTMLLSTLASPWCMPSIALAQSGQDPFYYPDDPFGATVDPFGGVIEPSIESRDYFIRKYASRLTPEMKIRVPVQEPLNTIPPKPSKSRLKISDAKAVAQLKQPISFDFIEAPFGDIAWHLEETIDVKVQVEYERLEEIGVGSDSPVTLRVQKMPAKSALNHILWKLDLGYMLRDGAIVITTKEALDDALIERKYPVADLALDDLFFPGGDKNDTLIENIQATIHPSSWEEVGGIGWIDAGDDSLTIHQSYPIQQQIEHYLTALRKARDLANTHPNSAPPVTSILAADNSAELIRAALDKKVSLSYIEQPLDDVAAELSKATGINVLLDTQALDIVGLSADTPNTINVEDISAAAGLSLILDQLDLSWTIRDDALIITESDAVEDHLQVRVYPVLDLVRDPAADGLELDEQFNDYDGLIDLLTAQVCPTSWDVVGGPASIGQGAFGCLTIAQTQNAFEEMDTFLTAYRKVLSEYRQQPERVFTAPVAIDHPRHEVLRERLRENASDLELKETPLADVADAITAINRIPIQLDHRALEDVGVDGSTSTSATLRDKPLGEALREWLKPYELTWVIRDEVVQITTLEEAEDVIVVKLYPVRDLLEREDDLDINAQAARGDVLYDIITEKLEPDTWEEQGGWGAVSTPLHPMLVVVQREDIHERLEKLLAELRTDEELFAGVAHRDPSQQLTNAKGEVLYDRNYELPLSSTEEAERVAEILRDLAETRDRNSQDGYSIRASMTGSTIVVRHTASMHRQIQRVLSELRLVQPHAGAEGLGGGFGGGGLGGGGLGGGPGNWGPAISPLAAMSLSAAHHDNTCGKTVMLQVIQLNVESVEKPVELIDEVQSAVEPDSWRENRVTAMHHFRGQLIVRHTALAQRKIISVLKKKDAIQKPQPVFGGVF